MYVKVMKVSLRAKLMKFDPVWFLLLDSENLQWSSAIVRGLNAKQKTKVRWLPSFVVSSFFIFKKTFLVPVSSGYCFFLYI